jgi:hypothetical protein
MAMAISIATSWLLATFLNVRICRDLCGPGEPLPGVLEQLCMSIIERLGECRFEQG